MGIFVSDILVRQGISLVVLDYNMAVPKAHGAQKPVRFEKAFYAKSEETYYTYSEIVKNHIIPAIVNKRMAEVKAGDVQKLFYAKTGYCGRYKWIFC